MPGLGQGCSGYKKNKKIVLILFILSGNIPPQAAKLLNEAKAPVAQLDRAPGFEPVGRRFESCRAHWKF